MQNDASVADQFGSCERHATRQGLAVAQRYSDHVVSGASLFREGIRRLIKDAATGTFDVIIAEDLDRLTCPRSRGTRAHHPVESPPNISWNTHSV
jgi:DNA invertase Pin-like site-specific DNA recombinase